MRAALILLVFIQCVLFQSCKRDDEQPTWDTEVLIPLLKSTLDINDLLNDTSLSVDADSSIKLVYQNHLYDVSLDSLFSIPDTGVTKVYNIDSLSLLDQTISYPVSLGYLANNAGGLVALFINSSNGNTVALPPIANLASDTFSINADTLFQTITLVTGSIDVSITNGFPIDITNLNFELRNTSNNVLVAQCVFPLIAAGQVQTQTVPLNGKTIEGNMTGRIISMSTPGSGGVPVLVDTSDVLIADLRVYDMHPSFATAIFPTQNLINKSQAFKFDLAPAQLKEAIINGGEITIDLYSTLQDSVHFKYQLPSAIKNGVPFEVSKTLDPAPPGGVSSFSNAYDFTGYHLDMSGVNQDTVNTMFNVFQARVDSTGQMKTLSITDSIYANISFVNLTPEYVRGYIGMDTFNFGPTSLSIDLFKNISANAFNVQDVKMNIEIENSIGADGEVYLQNLKSTNTQTNQTVTLSGSALTNSIAIPRAIDPGGYPGPVTSSLTNYLLNNSNSNASAFLDNLPNQIDYTLQLRTNPSGNSSNYQDFIYADKLMRFDLNVEVPLNFMADNLTLTDTVILAVNKVDLSRIINGTLILLADNGFPFDADVQLYLLDKTTLAVTDSLLINNIIAAASVDANGRVTASKRSRLIIPVTQDRINHFFESPKIKVVSRFTTKPTGQTIRIYSDYKMELQLTGDFNYRAN